MITDTQLQRYLKDRHAFRREQVILPNGQRYGDLEEDWQREHIWGPLDARTDAGGIKNHLLYLELARGCSKSTMGAMEVFCPG